MRFLAIIFCLFYCGQSFAYLYISSPRIGDHAHRQVHILGLVVTLAVQFDARAVELLALILDVLDFEPDAIEGPSFRADNRGFRFGVRFAEGLGMEFIISSGRVVRNACCRRSHIQY